MTKTKLEENNIEENKEEEIKHDPDFIEMAESALSELGLTEDEVERELEDFIG